MGDAVVADLASGLVLKLVSLATEELILAWNLDQDLAALRERLQLIDALLSDADSKLLTMSAVRNWFVKLEEEVASDANVFIDQLAYQVTRGKVESRGKVRGFFSVPSKNSRLYRIKMAHKIKSIHASCDKIFKWARDLGLQPVAHLSTNYQAREIHMTPPFEDESLVVGRENDISILVQRVCENYDEDLSRMVYNRDPVLPLNI